MKGIYLAHNMSRPEAVGREYEIDHLAASGLLMDYEDVLIHQLTEEDRRHTGKEQNIEGFVEYVWDGSKGYHARSIIFDKITPYFLRTSNMQHATKRFGILYLHEAITQFNFVSPSGDVLIPRGTDVADIYIPTVRFPKEEKKAVTPGMITKSFGLAADYFALHNDAKADFVIGLTHPRMGDLAQRRWGFSVEAHPLPEEVYQLIDLGLKDPEADLDEIKSLEALRKQVLVYQTMKEFIKRAPAKEDLHGGRQALKDLENPPKAAVLESARVIDRRSLQWDETGENLRLSRGSIKPDCSDEQILRDFRVAAVIRQEYEKGEIWIDGITVPFKTAPVTTAAVYKYLPGVQVVRVIEKGTGQENRPAIVIPRGSMTNVSPIIYFLSPQDRVIDPQNNSQIYP